MVAGNIVVHGEGDANGLSWTISKRRPAKPTPLAATLSSGGGFGGLTYDGVGLAEPQRRGRRQYDQRR